MKIGVVSRDLFCLQVVAQYVKMDLKRKHEPTDETGQKKGKISLEVDDTKEKGIKTADQDQENPEYTPVPVNWKQYRGENLDCDYCQLYSKSEADDLLKECNEQLSYNSGELSKVFIFGKWQDIPRQQVAYGDPGLSYSFSGHTVPARPWLPFLEQIKDKITTATGYDFNFVLINRYKDGSHYIGEHRDDERDLEPGHPIASLSLGQKRDFVFKHADSRGKNTKRQIDTVKVELEHGGLLMMKHPTNSYWYHSLPPRKKLLGPRINMTFRKMVLNTKT